MTDKEKFIKKNKKTGLIATIIGIIACCIDFIIDSGVLLVVGGIVVIVGLYFIFSKKSAKDKFCSQCGSSRNWDDADCIEWKVIGEINDGKKLEDTVEIRLTCPKCGCEDIRTKKVVVARIDDKGNVIRKNLDVEIRKMFQ
ncbi:MAG: hypothetical protein E7344_04655 [Clostridiales bacterium]|nr:hypothetical protein [Clostridiales bacterium]